MTEAINIAGQCNNGLLPVDGGLLDQSAWFMDCLATLNSDEAKIESEDWNG